MWHLLIAAAVAGSTGFAANRFLKLKSTASNTKPSISSLPIPQQTLPRNAVTPCPVENADLTIPQNFHETAIDNNNTDTQNKVFTFTSSKSPKKYGSPSQPKRYLNKPARVRRWSKAGIRVAKVELRSAALEHSNSGKKLLKKRKTNNHIAGNTAFCSPKGYTTSVLFYRLFFLIFQFYIPPFPEIQISKMIDLEFWNAF